MKINRQISAVVGVVVLGSTLVLAAVGFVLVRDNLDALASSSQETLLWSSLQVELELQRFNADLAGVVPVGDELPYSTPGEVNRRFDILWSRVGVLEAGSVGARMREYDDTPSTIKGLRQALRYVEDDVTMITSDDFEAVGRIRGRLVPFANPLRDLSRRVLHGESARQASLRADLSASSTFLFFMSAFVSVASLLLLYLFRRDSAHFRELARTNERLLMQSLETENLRSRFMTMMSHELRTPMNGILGLMSLMGQTRLNDRQAGLVAQANRSGRRMNDLLQDLMEFSELGAGRTKVAKLMLAEDLRDLLLRDAQAYREFATVDVLIRPGWTGPVCGDVRPVRQAADHLLKYLADRAGIDQVTVSLDCGDGGIIVDILPSGPDPSRQWRPEILTGAQDDAADQFASDAIGPAVARQIIAQLGGSLHARVGGAIVGVRMEIPAPRPEGQVNVGLVSGSISFQAICAAALHDAAGRPVELVDPKTAAIVLWDASGDGISSQVVKFAQENTSALLIGVGRGEPREGFDHWVDISSDLSGLRDRLAKYQSQVAEPSLG